MTSLFPRICLDNDVVFYFTLFFLNIIIYLEMGHYYFLPN
jgi:hypothetical protein